MCLLKTKIEAAEEGETDVGRGECSDTEEEQSEKEEREREKKWWNRHFCWAEIPPSAGRLSNWRMNSWLV